MALPQLAAPTDGEQCGSLHRKSYARVSATQPIHFDAPEMIAAAAPGKQMNRFARHDNS